MSADNLDGLLWDRFGLGRSDLIAGLRALPAGRPWAARLTDTDAALLDAAGFVDDPNACAVIAADTTTHMSVLYNSAYTAGEIADGLGLSDSRLRQRRLADTVWAIDDDGTWVYPAVQFEVVHRSNPPRHTLRVVRGLARVFPRLLTRRLHPIAVDNLLRTPHPDLTITGQRRSVRDWLLHGNPIEPVLALIDTDGWAT